MDDSAYYISERDGSLKDYVINQKRLGANPLFKGHGSYEQLRDGGFLVVDYSIIRLMWGDGRGDEHFQVVNEFKLEGLEGKMHSGREGIHDYKNILNDDAPRFEAHNLKPVK